MSRWARFVDGFWQGVGAVYPGLRRRFCAHEGMRASGDGATVVAHCDDCGTMWGGEIPAKPAPVAPEAEPELVAVRAFVRADLEADAIRDDAHRFSKDPRPQ